MPLSPNTPLLTVTGTTLVLAPRPDIGFGPSSGPFRAADAGPDAADTPDTADTADTAEANAARRGVRRVADALRTWSARRTGPPYDEGPAA
ncbi:hypothetical protein [Streptomyces sp. NPDC051569]|uniref:hypothetical protein n=1 Tax=Streptomyces sp. NPDC051569 TaxID=3365661 RepID=UPI0037B04966